MNWKTTWLLLLCALGLFTFIYLVERHTRSSSSRGEAADVLIPIQASEVTGVLLRGTNNVFVARAIRTNAHWQLTQPVPYPAQDVSIDRLLDQVSQLTSRTHISLQELSEQNQTLADFGLDQPLASLTLEINRSRHELLFGRKTPLGDDVYLQVNGRPGIYVVSTELFDTLPRSASDWRNPTLVDSSRMNVNRMEVRVPGGGLEIYMETNQVFYLTKPTLARADVPKVQQLFMTVGAARVVEFITDDPHVELEPYGLAPPAAELVFGWGTNDLLVVQFGTSPASQPELVYARRLSETNIVLVPRTVLEALRIPPNDLRDKRVLSFNPAHIVAIEVRGSEPFSVRHQSNNVWVVSGNPPFVADSELIRRWVRLMNSLEGVVDKDVVTEFGHYGLAEPLRQYILKTVVTDPATGDLAIAVLDQLDVGARDPDRVYVRRATENTVYTISRTEHDQMPTEAWQLRDRRVWRFNTNDVRSVTLSRKETTRRIVRNNAGSWSLAPGSTGVLKSPQAINPLLEQLGYLQAEIWVDRGTDRKAFYGFRPDGYRMEIELSTGADRKLVLEFGGMAPSQFPYALATAEGESWIFEFPLTLFVELLRDLPIQSTP